MQQELSSRTENILETIAFIRYCKEQGICLTEIDLSYLHSNQLLQPSMHQAGQCVDTYQHIVLKIILRQKHWQSDFKDNLSDADIKLLQEKIERLYLMLNFYFDALELDKKWMKEMRRIYKKEVEEIGEDQAVLEWPIIFNSEVLQKMKQEAESVLSKHKLTISEVEGWRFQLSELCHLKRNKTLEQYLRFIPPDYLINAEETNKMICILNRYLWLLTGERRTVKQILLGMSERPCEICCGPIKQRANKKEQYTCGDEVCIAKRDARLKRLKRRQQSGE